MNSPHEIANERLRREHLPGPEDEQLTWIRFALTFDGYAEKGSSEACAKFANSARDRWEQTGTLPVGLNDLRAALFFEQRRWRWSNEDSFTDKEWRYWRSLVEAIRHELPQEDLVRVKRVANEQVLDLYSEIDAHGGKRSVWLRLTSEGNLILEGSDYGEAVNSFWGSTEYEWGWCLPPERLDLLLKSLGIAEVDPPDLLETIATALNALERTKIQEKFKEAGAEFWSWVGD